MVGECRLFATFRFASGTAFTRCPAESGNEFVFSGRSARGQFEGDINGARLPMLKQFNLRLTKGFGLGGVDVTAYADIRNLFNFTNTTSVYAVTNDVNSGAAFDETVAERPQQFRARSVRPTGPVPRTATSSLPPPTRRAATGWRRAVPRVPSCIYLIRAEQRYGDGDGRSRLWNRRRPRRPTSIGPGAAGLHRCRSGSAVGCGVELLGRD